ncbi:autotransporter outer membrane beta-barrel domain-containing protein [Campylobacter jejuni]|uniref:autotransporter outer membrane beta-barrel domain-containing protein n=1 Tax=Campylobacter jejuni TaxID=197 RepID=UPI00207BBCF5|nr:autotransporter outer membrane beta-barrel domain-containing protein [Campylobacter jejuni]
MYSPRSPVNTTVIGSHTSSIETTDQGPHTIIIQADGTLGSKGNTGNIIYASTNNGNTLTLANLTNNGTINGKVAIQNSNSFTGTIAVNTFENIGQINGQIYMGVWGGYSGTLNIDKFENSGTITASNNDKGIFFEGKNTNIETFNNSGTITSSSIAIDVANNSNINYFTNSGFISAGKGVNIGQGSMTNFTNASGGTIQGTEAGVLINTKIDTFTNNGFINSPGSGEWSNGIWISGDTRIDNFSNTGTIQGGGNGIYMNYGYSSGSYIKNFSNTGTIKGEISGIILANSTIDNFTNDGLIESTGEYGAIDLQSFYQGVSLIKTLENKGTIKGLNDGIIVETGNKIETLVNKGTIEATNGNGISFYFMQHAATEIDLGNIILENGSKIIAGNNGINVDITQIDASNEQTTIKGQGIDVKKGASVIGKNGAGIYIGDGQELNTQITIAGEVSGGAAGIVNEGIIGGSSDDDKKGGIIISGGSVSSSSGGSGIVNQGNGSIAGEIKVESGGSVEGGITNTGSGSISGNIVVENGGKLDSITNTSNSDTGISGSITNNSDNKLEISNGEGATIGGGITNNGNADLVISNQGSVGKDENGNTVTNNGSGSVGIKDWVVSTDKETGKLDTVVVGGSGKDNVKVENITVDQSNVNLDELGNINNIISGVNQGNIGNIGTNGGGEISLSFDPITGKLTTDFNLNASISGATFRSLISTTSRRSTFIDNVMGNSMQTFALASSSKSQSIAMSEKGNLYADASDYIKSDLNNGSYGSNKEHSLFILPYTSSQNVELSLNEESKGHTKGTIIGYSTLKDSGIYGMYAGYEDTKMGSTYFDINNRTYYAGLKYFNTLFTTEKGQEVYIKAQGKAALIKNDLTKKIGNNEAKAEPNSYAYGVNTALGMNFISNKDIFSPEIGLAYEGGYTEAFSMKDTIGQATVKGGERTYANYLNLFSTKTSFTWFRDWLPNLKTSVELGAKFNINPKVEAEARFGNIKVSDEFDLPRIQKFVSTSLIIPVNEAFYFSLNYNGMFDKDGNTHTGFAQFNYLW